MVGIGLTVCLTGELRNWMMAVHGLNMRRVRIINRIGDMTTCKHGRRRFLVPTCQLDWSTKKRRA